MHHLLNIIEYFASLRASRHGDPFTAGWKFKQLQAWVSLVLLGLALVVVMAVGNMLETMEAASMLRPLADQLRPKAAYVLGVAFAIVGFFAIYAWGSVLRFALKHGAE